MKKTRLSLIILTLIASQPAVPAEPYVTTVQARLDQALNYATETINKIKNYLQTRTYSKKEKLALAAAMVYLYGAIRAGSLDPRRVVLQQLPGDVYRTRVWLGEKIATPLF